MFGFNFNRNARAGDLLELFLVAAISSLLLTRFYLELTHYPQIGGSLHIAHMLPGGLLMLTAIVILVSFIGYRTQRLASVIGGLGFGLFIDEIGKFITSDNNYFFQPTVALLYIIFVLLFLSFRRLSHVQKLSQTEYLLNALALTEEAVLHDLDSAERKRIQQYLHHADSANPLVVELTSAFERIEVIGDPTISWLGSMRNRITATYRRFITSRAGIRTVDGVFVAKAVWSIAAVLIAVANFSEVDTNQLVATWLQFTSSGAALTLVIAGVYAMRRSRLRAYDLFLKSALVEIFLTQFFAFYREGFSALPIFIVNVLLYISVRLLIAQEKRLLSRHQNPSAIATPASA
jgi:hypothetical protein